MTVRKLVETELDAQPGVTLSIVGGAPIYAEVRTEFNEVWGELCTVVLATYVPTGAKRRGQIRDDAARDRTDVQRFVRALLEPLRTDTPVSRTDAR